MVFLCRFCARPNVFSSHASAAEGPDTYFVSPFQFLSISLVYHATTRDGNNPRSGSIENTMRFRRLDAPVRRFSRTAPHVRLRKRTTFIRTQIFNYCFCCLPRARRGWKHTEQPNRQYRAILSTLRLLSGRGAHVRLRKHTRIRSDFEF